MALQHRLGLLSSRRARFAFNHYLNSCLTGAHLAARAGSVLAFRHDRHVLDEMALPLTCLTSSFAFPLTRIRAVCTHSINSNTRQARRHAAFGCAARTCRDLPISRRPDNRLFFFKALATKHDKTQVADAAEAVTELDHKYSKFKKELTFDAKDRPS